MADLGAGCFGSGPRLLVDTWAQVCPLGRGSLACGTGRSGAPGPGAVGKRRQRKEERKRERERGRTKTKAGQEELRTEAARAGRAGTDSTPSPESCPMGWASSRGRTKKKKETEARTDGQEGREGHKEGAKRTEKAEGGTTGSPSRGL